MPPERALRDARFRFTPQLFVGLIVIVVGVLMTLDNLQVLEAQRAIGESGGCRRDALRAE